MGIESIKRPKESTEDKPKSADNGVFILEKIQDIFDKNPFTKQTILALGVLTSSFGNMVKAETNTEVQQIDSGSFYEQISKQEPSDLTKIVQKFQQIQEQLTEKDKEASWSGHRLSLKKYGGGANLKAYEISTNDFPMQGSGVIEMSSVLGTSRQLTEKSNSLFSGMYQHYRIVDNNYTIEPDGDSITMTFKHVEGAYDNMEVLDVIDEKLSELGINIKTELKVGGQKETREGKTLETKRSVDEIIESHHSIPLTSWLISTQESGDGVTTYTIELQPGTIVDTVQKAE